jgi:hypothetical protein
LGEDRPLLPQPRDFEGLGLARAAPPPDGLVVAPPRDLPVRLLKLRPALNAFAAKMVPRDGHVSKIAYLLDLRREVGVDAVSGGGSVRYRHGDSKRTGVRDADRAVERNPV